MMETRQSLLINYNWHHAVNDQSKLDQALKVCVRRDDDGTDGDGETTRATTDVVEAIEADIIYSEVKSQAVMGHPPLLDGDLTLASFLQQLREMNFQQRHDHSITNPAVTECPVLKLDFKSMTALQSSLPDVESYLNILPSSIHRVWINADILPGPGEDLNDTTAQKKMQPKFDTAEFLKVVTAKFPGTVLSIGWTTSLTDIDAVYTDDMVSEMIQFAKPYTNVTFPVRGSCFRKSWDSIRRLYQTNNTWTVTLWWSHELAKEEFDWIYRTLENDKALKNRTYYDLAGFRKYLSVQGNIC